MRIKKFHIVALLALLMTCLILSECSKTNDGLILSNVTQDNISQSLNTTNFSNTGAIPPKDNSSTTMLNIDICKDSERLILCGTDGITYSSECALFKTGAKIEFIGSCTSNSSLILGTNCSEEKNLVCGFRKVYSTYKNSCLANYYNASIRHEGPCTEKDITVCEDSSPVCGVNNVTYGGECAAIAHNTVVAYKGKCVFNNKDKKINR